jgi:hypothetical protein
MKKKKWPHLKKRYDHIYEKRRNTAVVLNYLIRTEVKNSRADFAYTAALVRQEN